MSSPTALLKTRSVCSRFIGALLAHSQLGIYWDPQFVGKTIFQPPVCSGLFFFRCRTWHFFLLNIRMSVLACFFIFQAPSEGQHNQLVNLLILLVLFGCKPARSLMKVLNNMGLRISPWEMPPLPIAMCCIFDHNPLSQAVQPVFRPHHCLFI